MNDPIFQRGLQDLIKGIRSNKKDSSSFISQSIAEIKVELKSTDPFVKSEAVRKLTYLQMIGYNVSWASFAIVEVMSQSRFSHKRIGYLAANQSFDESTDVILLTTNLFKKEFSSNLSNNQYEIGLAINCLANIATKDLARDCIADLVTLMNHSKPYIRKKAVLAMFKLYVKFPQGLRLTFDKLKERLDDPDSSVVSTAVNVICELANKNPKNYVSMAPKFFRLLTSSSNNWMLIKVVKLLGSLVSEEPRLARKLLEPMATIIQNTGAKSLQFECIYTVTEALPHSRRDDGSEAKNAESVIQLCSDYLRGFIEDSDPNLKYLGLVGLLNLMKCHPRSVVEHRDLVLRCLNDDDVTIRTKALELLAGIVSKKSLVDLVHHLLEHTRLSEGAYRDELISQIVSMCRRDRYAMVEDFAWYTSVLLQLAVMPGAKHGKDVADQLIEISLRVEAVRPFAVDSMVSMLLDDRLFVGQHAKSSLVEMMRAAAWIVGEYADVVSLIAADDAPIDDDGANESSRAYWIEGVSDDFRSSWRGQDVHVLLLGVLLHPRVAKLPRTIVSAHVQAAMKLFIRACCDCSQMSVAGVLGVVRNRLSPFSQHPDLEVQERASAFRHVLSEFEILPLDWETTAAVRVLQDNTRVSSDDQATVLNLLDFSAHGSAREHVLDDEGAVQAMDKRSVLRAVVAESFFAVHSKAQRRISVSDLDLHVAFDADALDALLATDMPTSLGLQNLSFCDVSTESAISFGAESRMSSAKSYDDDFAHRSTGDSSTRHRDYSDTAVDKKNSDSRLSSGYVLQDAAAASMDPLSKLLADTFEDPSVVPAKSDRRSDRKKSKKKQHTPAAFYAEDQQLDSDVSDEITGGRRRKHEKSSHKQRLGSNDSNEVGLDSVDLSTPLRPDETFAVHSHRVVSDPQERTSSRSTLVSVTDGKKSRSGDTKEKRRKKAEKNIPDHQASDLLSAEKSLLDLTADIGISEQLAGNVKIQAAVGPEKTKKVKFWQVLYRDQQALVLYSLSDVANTMTLYLKAKNLSLDGAALSVSLFPPPKQDASGVCWLGGHERSVQLCGGMAEGESSVSSVQLVLERVLDVHPTPLISHCSVAFAVDSLLGLETKTAICGISLDVCCTLAPLKLGESEFSAALSKSSSRWGDNTVQVSYEGKCKAAFRSIAAHLRAHTVESESTKAVSLSAKTPAGDKVFVLAKAADSATIIVSIKCLCASRSESVALAEAVGRALQNSYL